MIIFLDIDGVLATSSSVSNMSDKLFRPAIKALNLLCDRARVGGIVISSAWRVQHTLKELQNIFHTVGVSCPVVGVTPVTGKPLVRGLDRGRAAEIRGWMDITGYWEDYIVIDDNIADLVPHIPTDKIIYVKDGWQNNGLTNQMVEEWLHLHINS